MIIDATFWVAISFIIFVLGLVYLKIPNKINNNLNQQINLIKDEIKNAERLKDEAKSLLNEYEDKRQYEYIYYQNQIILNKSKTKLHRSRESKSLQLYI